MHIRLAIPRDLADLATIARDAMFDDELTLSLAPYRHQHPECLRQGYLRLTKKRYYAGHLVLAAVTDDQDAGWNGTERVVGYASAVKTDKNSDACATSWFFWNALELRLLRFEEISIWYTHADRSISGQSWLQFQNNITDRGPLANIKEYWNVEHLSVDPSFHRRGVGSALIKHVQTLASRDDLPVLLVASVKGRPMYKKLGFTDHGPCDMVAGDVAEAMV